jgi:hypothetical protein
MEKVGIRGVGRALVVEADGDVRMDDVNMDVPTGIVNKGRVSGRKVKIRKTGK